MPLRLCLLRSWQPVVREALARRQQLQLQQKVQVQMQA